MNQVWRKTTDEQICEMIERYIKGEKTKILAKDYGITCCAVLGFLKRRNIPIRPEYLTGNKKYTLNETFFDVIDTEEKAYFLGFLYADGCNDEKKKTVVLKLQDLDKEILEILSMVIETDKPIKQILRKENNARNQYSLVITNKHISQQLAKLGCMQAKTFKITFPEWLIPELHHHFIRGYFDGDGCIMVGKKYHGPSFRITGTASFVTRVQEIMMKEIGLNKTKLDTLHKSSERHVFNMGYVGTNSCKKIYKWLYKDATISLARKHQKFTIVNNSLSCSSYLEM